MKIIQTMLPSLHFALLWPELLQGHRFHHEKGWTVGLRGHARYGGMVCEQQEGTVTLTSFSDGVPALLPCTDFCLLNTSHVYMQGALCPVGKYTVRPDCAVISTTHHVTFTLGSAGKIKLSTVELAVIFFFLFAVWIKMLWTVNCSKCVLKETYYAFPFVFLCFLLYRVLFM